MRFLYPLLVLVPIAAVMEFGGIGGHAAVFVVSALALVPLAAVLGRATEEVAIFTGPKIGALLSATPGNREGGRIGWAEARSRRTWTCWRGCGTSGP